jgi:hypothetical protein
VSTPCGSPCLNLANSLHIVAPDCQVLPAGRAPPPFCSHQRRPRRDLPASEQAGGRGVQCTVAARRPYSNLQRPVASKADDQPRVPRDFPRPRPPSRPIAALTRSAVGGGGQRAELWSILAESIRRTRIPLNTAAIAMPPGSLSPKKSRNSARVLPVKAPVAGEGAQLAERGRRGRPAARTVQPWFTPFPQVSGLSFPFSWYKISAHSATRSLSDFGFSQP